MGMLVLKVIVYPGGTSSEDSKKRMFLFVMPLMNKGMTTVNVCDCIYHIAWKFGGNNVWQKWMDDNFGKKVW